MPDPARRPGQIVVLASGTGSLFDALVAASRASVGDVRIAGLVCDQPHARVVGLATDAGVPARVLPLSDRSRRSDWDDRMADALVEMGADLVVSAGFMRLLGPAVLGRFPRRIVNSHPALLPAFPGAHAVHDALSYGVKVTGCTVHLVDAGVDTGPVIAQQAVDVRADDDEASLHERIKDVERRLLPEVTFRMMREGWTTDGRRVTIP